jgi:predicted GNAT family acetyltransferase
VTAESDDRVTEVRNNEAESRYELLLDGEVVGVAEYRPTGDGSRLVFPHTEIVEPLRGQGLGDRLIRAALDDVRRAGRTLDPSCWAVAEFINEHREYADLVTR